MVCSDVSEGRTACLLQPSEKKLFNPPKRRGKPNVNPGVQTESRPRFGQQSQGKAEHFLKDARMTIVGTAKLFLVYICNPTRYTIFDD